MRITYTEGVGIPIENLGDEEVEELERLLADRSFKNLQRLVEERRAEDAAPVQPVDTFYGFWYA